MFRNALLLSVILVPCLGSAQTLFEQTPSGDNIGYPTDGISTNASQFWEVSSADNFSLSSASTVGAITFWGGSGDGSGNLVSPNLDNINSFDIQIYNSNFSTTLFSTNVAKSSLAAVATGQTLTDGFDGFQGGNEYMLTLSGLSVNLAAGSYWLAIGSVNADPNGDTFLWTAATADGTYAENFFDGTGFNVFTDTSDPDQDQAFRLTAAAVPEPAPIAILGVGALGLLLRRRR